MRMIRWGLEGACSGQNKEHPQDAHILILQKSWISYLTWHKGVCRFKLQILKWGDYGDGPNLITWVHTKSLQLCLTLYDPMDYSPPGSSVHGILQATRVEWRVVSFSWRRTWQPTAVFLPGESSWTEEPGRIQSMGSQRFDRTEGLHFHSFP